jgi:hypothetical protein
MLLWSVKSLVAPSDGVVKLVVDVTASASAQL